MSETGPLRPGYPPEPWESLEDDEGRNVGGGGTAQGRRRGFRERAGVLVGRASFRLPSLLCFPFVSTSPTDGTSTPTNRRNLTYCLWKSQRYGDG